MRQFARPQSSKTASRRPTIKRTSSQTFSPPSSPMSPGRSFDSARSHQTAARPDPTRKHVRAYDADSDAEASSLSKAGRRYQNGIPTPSKTPRKRPAHDGSQLKSTARVLFPTVHAGTDIVAPTPRKSRKGRHANFTLDSFDDEAAGDEIKIYTDSKERIPEEDAGEENPFLSRSSSARANPPAQVKSRTRLKHGMSKEIDEAVERGEGMVYVL